MAPFSNLLKKKKVSTRQDITSARTALKGCQDNAVISMSVCGDPSK